MAASTEAAASHPTDVFALTASPALSAREVITFPQSLYITLPATAQAVFVTSHCVAVTVGGVDLVMPFARAMRFVVEHLPNQLDFRNYQFFPHLLLNDPRGELCVFCLLAQRPPNLPQLLFGKCNLEAASSVFVTKLCLYGFFGVFAGGLRQRRSTQVIEMTL